MGLGVLTTEQEPPAWQAEHGDVRVVAAGVDSLFLGYRGAVPRRVVRELEQAKAAADAARRRPVDPRTREPLGPPVKVESVELGGQTWEVRAYGSSQAPFLLVNDDFQAAVNPGGRSGPELQVRTSARALWRDGAGAAVKASDELASAVFGGVEPVARWVQRIDLAVDHQGFEPDLGMLDRFSAPGGLTKHTFTDDEPAEETLEPAEFWARWKLTGFRFGRGGPCVVRWYDKRAEVGVSGKRWFEDVWGAREGYSEGAPVWRLEVQLRRELLKVAVSSSGQPLESVEDVLANVAELWRHVTLRRLRLTTHEEGRKDRAPTDSRWQVLAETEQLDGVVGEDGRVTLDVQLVAEADALLPPIRGYIASWAAAMRLEFFEDAVLEVAKAVEQLSEDEDLDLEKLIKSKAKRRRARELDALGNRRRPVAEATC